MRQERRELIMTAITPSAGGAAADTGAGEQARLASVARYDILDTSPEAAFDRVAAVAARLLNAPIATVSIVDADRIWFKAAHGLDGMTQVGRDPGLCASAILHDAPVYVVSDAVSDPRARKNPLVQGQLAVRFYAAAAIVTSGGHRLGTVDVFDTRPRELTDTEMATLCDLAALVTDLLESRLAGLTTLTHERAMRTRAERDAAMIEDFVGTLQRTLLPPTLPRVPELELECHYYAASPREVTGDFYDVFSLGDGRWGFFLGDVAGHGAPAAAVTSLVRYTLRTAALHDPDPVAGLTELNNAMLMDTHSSRFCTVMFGIMTPGSSSGFDLTLAGGGHPPAMWLRPGSDVVDRVRPVGGMLVGALPDARFTSVRLHLDPGDTLLLYTDGLTEARPSGAFFGEDGLAAFLSGRTRTGAGKLVCDLTELIDGFDPAPTDDVALLAMTVSG
jgi:sigma-B regulation protein RsbU (phosphoserine phosphatase)